MKKVNLLISVLLVLITVVFAASCVPVEKASAPAEGSVKNDEPAKTAEAPAPVRTPVPTETKSKPSQSPAPTETKSEPSQSPAPTETGSEPTPVPSAAPSESPETTVEIVGELTAEPEELSYPIGLFSWEADAYTSESGARLYMMLKALGVTEIYQSFEDGELETKDADRLLRDAHTMGVDVYYLAGSREWGLEKNGKSMIRQIELVEEYNKKHKDAPFKGIMFDVEAFLNEAWEKDPEAVMDSFASGSLKMYQRAQKAGVRIIHCVPAWYDSHGYSEQLKMLCDSCDELSVMNYDRRSEVENMRTETELAREAEKPITCIFEFQNIKYHGLTGSESYYSEGIRAAVESFEKLYSELDYEGMKFAYHFFRPLNEIID